MQFDGKRRSLSLESMEKRMLLAADLGIAVAAHDSPAVARGGFSFGIEREMKESGEKGGTEDINIGVGELQEYLEGASTDAAIVAWDTAGDADDRPTEEVAFYYNKISMQRAGGSDGVVDAADYLIWRR